MKKFVAVLFIIAFSCIMVWISFFKKNSDNIGTYYDVYFQGNRIGTIRSEKELISYIDKKQENIKKNYSVDQVNIPNDISIQKVMTYTAKVDNVSDVYDTIAQMAAFTIDGYQVSISNSYNNFNIYVTDMAIFEEAVENIIETYVGIDEYAAYKNESQKEIDGIGSYINDVYLNDNIIVKSTTISVNEQIFSSVDELTQFLLYGTEGQQKKYIASIGDTIESVAFKNQINVKEFMISNPQITSTSSLLYPGQELTIGVTDPQIEVTVEKDVVEETALKYKTVETVDENEIIGTVIVVQEGKDGVIRVSQKEKYVNGSTVYVEPLSKEILEPSVDRIIIKGGRKVSGVGSLTDWAWPTDSGWVLTDTFSWRINPINGLRELHGALDIAGTGYGSPVYAANNGIVTAINTNDVSGNYIYIDHNNGFSTEYCHMSAFANLTVGQAVEKGQVIGYVGMTGWATGPHLHFAVWQGSRPWAGGTRIDPLLLYQ